jgi:hypothetical protein
MCFWYMYNSLCIDSNLLEIFKRKFHLVFQKQHIQNKFAKIPDAGVATNTITHYYLCVTY